MPAPISGRKDYVRGAIGLAATVSLAAVPAEKGTAWVVARITVTANVSASQPGPYTY